MASSSSRQSRTLATTDIHDESAGRGRRDPVRRVGLVIAWSRSEPERVGEVVLTPAAGKVGRLGRREPSDDPDHLTLMRQRPGRNLPTGALRSRGVSRSQLELSCPKRGELHLANIGRRSMLVDGATTEHAVLRAGDLVELDGELILLCVERPERMPALRWADIADGHVFGGPDRFGIVGESEATWLLRDELAFLGAAGGHVLILGETGAGKELAANAIHSLSPWGRSALVARNAATFPPGLIDAELFGNVRNFPHSGSAPRPGLIGEADQSTLFLDEIADLPREMQTHLLRVLDTGGEYQRLGESTTRRSEFRLVGATNRSQSDMRSDFRARFGHTLQLTGLVDRREDILLIFQHLARLTLEGMGTPLRPFVTHGHGTERYVRVGPGLAGHLLRNPPPANARGLRQALLHAARYSKGDLLDAWMEPGEPAPTADAPGADEAEAYRDTASFTADEIRACLEKHDGVQGPVWRELKMRNRYVLQRLIKKFGL